MTKPIEPEPFYDSQERVEELSDDDQPEAQVEASSPFESAFRKNELIIPSSAPRGVHCPKCKSTEYTGRAISGVVEFTCSSASCKNKWHGGLPGLPEDPRRPLAAHYVAPPPLSIEKDPRTNRFVEVHKPVDPTPSFRKGALLPPGED